MKFNDMVKSRRYGLKKSEDVDYIIKMEYGHCVGESHYVHVYLPHMDMSSQEFRDAIAGPLAEVAIKYDMYDGKCAYYLKIEEYDKANGKTIAEFDDYVFYYDGCGDILTYDEYMCFDTDYKVWVKVKRYGWESMGCNEFMVQAPVDTHRLKDALLPYIRDSLNNMENYTEGDYADIHICDMQNPYRWLMGYSYWVEGSTEHYVDAKRDMW